ncbi:MAG: hypothetical protein OIF38_01315, partial [Cellvibrionaceae bacterium]|nr:hypothetical protein [Cellvibrionaceae bacterium]
RHTLFEIIQIPEVSAQLKNKIVTSSTGPMSFMMSQIGRIPVLDEYFYDIAQTAQQPSVRAKAYRQLFEQRVVWLEGRRFEWTDIRYCKGKVKPITGERKVEVTVLFLKLLSSSAIDNSSIVRRVAAEFLIKDIENLGDLGQKLANTFAADKSKAVAGRGQFALKKLQELS